MRVGISCSVHVGGRGCFLAVFLICVIFRQAWEGRLIVLSPFFNKPVLSCAGDLPKIYENDCQDFGQKCTIPYFVLCSNEVVAVHVVLPICVGKGKPVNRRFFL